MKITVESTDQIVRLAAYAGGEEIECRVWEGTTARGTRVQCLIPRIAALPPIDQEFTTDLRETRAPEMNLAFPLRMIL